MIPSIKNEVSWSTALIGRARIDDADVASIRRKVFPLGLHTRQDAEAMFDVDQILLDKCAAWTELFAELLVDHLVWGERPTGRIEQDAAEWVLARVGGNPTLAGMATLVALTQEAVGAPPWFYSAVGHRASTDWRGPLHQSDRLAA